MSQYYSIRIGYVHEEDYETWYLMCRLLHECGLLDEETKVFECGQWESTDNEFFQMLDAFRKGDDHPERYVADFARKELAAMVKTMSKVPDKRATFEIIRDAYLKQLKPEGKQ